MIEVALFGLSRGSDCGLEPAGRSEMTRTDVQRPSSGGVIACRAVQRLRRAGGLDGLAGIGPAGIL
jgi:hypothetical protein